MPSNFTIGSVKIRVGADAATLARDLDKAKRILERSGRELQSIGANISQKVTLPLGLLGAASLKTFADLEALKKGLIAVSGSADKANAEFEKLREVAKLPGLGLEEAVQGSVALQAAGFSANEARRSLLAFGNALATVGKGKAELSLVQLALTQLQNKTSGYGQEIRQLTEQLPQLRGALTNAFGTADSEKIAKLGITGKQVVAILTQEFEKMPKVSGGLKNAFENASDSIKIAFANLGESINKSFNIEGLINKVADFITRMSDGFKALSPEVQKTILTIAGIAAAIGPVVFIIGKVQTLIGAVTGLFSLMASGGVLAGLKISAAFGPVGIAIAAVSAAVVAAIVYWDDLKNAWNNAYAKSQLLRDSMGALKLITDILTSTVKALLEPIFVLGKAILNLIAAADGTISIKQAFSNIYEDAKQAGKNTVNNFVQGFKDADLANKLSKLTAATGIQSISGNRVDSFKKLRDINKVKSDEANVLGDIKPPKFDNVIEAVKSLKQKIKEIDALGDLGIDTNPIQSKINVITAEITAIIEKGAKPGSKAVQDLKLQLDDLTKQQFRPEIDVTSLNEAIKKADELTAKINSAIADQINSSQSGKKFGEGTFNDRLKSGLNPQINTDTKNTNTEFAANEIGKIKDLTNELNSAINNELVNSIQDLSVAFGNLFSGEISGATFFNSILNVIADFGIKIGKQLIALSVASQAFKKLLANPVAAAVAGIGLISLSTAFKNSLNKGPSLAIGTNKVLSDGIAQIHKGEAIVPAKVVEGGFKTVNNTSLVEKLKIELSMALRGTDLILANQYSQPLLNIIK